MVAFNGIFLSVDELFMLVAQLVWYEFAPGVIDTGFFNQHFIRDIGIIQLFLGVAFGVGMIRAAKFVSSSLCAIIDRRETSRARPEPRRRLLSDRYEATGAGAVRQHDLEPRTGLG